MKSLLVALTVLALSTVALAYPGPDSMALYTDADAAGVPNLSLDTTAPFEPITLYLCISNPSLGGVSGWEGIAEYTGSLTAPSWTVTAGLDVDSNDTNSMQRFQVGIGLAPAALEPNGNGNVVLATFTAFVLSATDVVNFFIRGIPESQTFMNPATPGYVGPTDAGQLARAVNLAGDPTLPVFCINDDCGIVGNEDMTFSSVKSLFR